MKRIEVRSGAGNAVLFLEYGWMIRKKILIAIAAAVSAGVVVVIVRWNAGCWLPRSDVAKTDLHSLENCLDLYKFEKRRYPTTEEGLQALVGAGKCKANLKDPWGRPYVYRLPGKVHPESYDVMSYGADGQPGGEGPNADIVNQ